MLRRLRVNVTPSLVLSLLGIDQSSAPETETGVAFATLPIPAPVPIDSAALLLDDFLVDDEGCAGTAAAPDPAPGKLCVYVVTTENVASGDDAISLRQLGPDGSRFGFGIDWVGGNDGDGVGSMPSLVQAVWADEAPAA